MKLKTFINYIKSGQIFLLLKLSQWSGSFYKLNYIAALLENGFAKYLSPTPRSLEEIAENFQINSRDALEAWLQIGVRLKVLDRLQGRYKLAEFPTKLLKPENDALAAIAQEITTLHYKLIVDTPKRLQRGELWGLHDQEGAIIARSSRIVEPLQRDLITTLFPSKRAMRLLEVGCGSGIYLKHAAEHNPQLTAIGVEMQDDVVAMARENITTWGLQERVEIVQGDIRRLSFDVGFDIVTLYNNIYYFPVDERVALLKNLFRFLNPEGFLVLTTACQGGQPLSELLNLWGASTEGCGRLPYVSEMIQQMETAGFVKVRKKRVLPGDSFFAFVGYHP